MKSQLVIMDAAIEVKKMLEETVSKSHSYDQNRFDGDMAFLKSIPEDWPLEVAETLESLGKDHVNEALDVLTAPDDYSNVANNNTNINK